MTVQDELFNIDNRKMLLLLFKASVSITQVFIYHITFREGRGDTLHLSLLNLSNDSLLSFELSSHTSLRSLEIDYISKVSM